MAELKEMGPLAERKPITRHVWTRELRGDEFLVLEQLNNHKGGDGPAPPDRGVRSDDVGRTSPVEDSPVVDSPLEAPLGAVASMADPSIDAVV